MKEINIPNKARVQIQGLLMQKAEIESALKMYTQGFMDAKGLQGDCNLDTTRWVFVERVKEPKEEAK